MKTGRVTLKGVLREHVCKQTDMLETDSHEENRKHAWGGYGDSMLSCESVCFVLVAFPYNSIYFCDSIKENERQESGKQRKSKGKGRRKDSDRINETVWEKNYALE